ncbi:BON domain-containing protein [Undibacterium hunanense]|nr:BON domain-containing protein [Undibacterium hunanense]
MSLPICALGDEVRTNYFNDPFLRVTQGISECPVPEGPMLTEAQARAEAHGRIERGTSCYQSGQCRLPNSYLYDKEIIPRVKRAIEADGRFAETSIWVEGQRRFVWLKGCVRTTGQASELEKLVRSLDDVQGVMNQLIVK